MRLARKEAQPPNIPHPVWIGPRGSHCRYIWMHRRKRLFHKAACRSQRRELNLQQRARIVEANSRALRSTRMPDDGLAESTAACNRRRREDVLPGDGLVLWP